MTRGARLLIGSLGLVLAGVLSVFVYLATRTDGDSDSDSRATAPRAGPLRLPSQSAPASPTVAASPGGPAAPGGASVGVTSEPDPGTARVTDHLERLSRLDPNEIRTELTSAAARFPGVEVKAVACIDRPCQADVVANNMDALNGFLADAGQRYQGHVRFSYERKQLPTGGEQIRAVLSIGTLEAVHSP